MKILHVVGARPNFMKAAPVMAACAKRSHCTQMLVHTGQHYDANMSAIFFQELGLPEPDINLEVGSGSHAIQTAQIMMAFEKVVLEHTPDIVLVYGDINSTVAVAIVCAKLGIKVGHVEAGLRSFDRCMPEEINRLLTDQIANMLFTPSADGNQHLQAEGVAAEKIHLVGNVMIDTLVRLLPQAEARWSQLHRRFGLANGYGLITLHRPSNVDDPDMLPQILATLDRISQKLTLLFPLHPRTRQRIASQGLEHLTQNICLVEPLGYLDFLILQKRATIVITDSGGIQEETTYLQVPCLTVRENTERPITVTIGTNKLIGQDMALLEQETYAILNSPAPQGQIPPLWDGQAGERIAAILLD
ncbi:MAG: UDP-N-acetylglucosamine 2-epimerase (non-hydrolyzing) [Anaerolineales bacterium]|nr:UDP-N-acetylglucosamine 2-epimerase (non-hydrolyzing) [Anaerolineales bacterium]